MSGLWEDRDVRFFIGNKLVNPRPGEAVVKCFQNVEDSRGNRGEMGQLIVTTLRIVWHLSTLPKVNVSIGYNCIENITKKERSSKFTDSTETMNLLAKSTARYEFSFTMLGDSGLFQTVNDVCRAYLSTKLYRDLRFNFALSEDKQIILLPQEEILEVIDGVWNLSNTQGNLGTFFITSVRVIWISNTNKAYNGSIPHIQIKGVGTRNTKFGRAVVITAMRQYDNYVMGFQIHPEERLLKTSEDLQRVCQSCKATPNFGVRCERTGTNYLPDEIKVVNESEDTEIDSSMGEDTCSAYLVEGESERFNPKPVFSKELGLAIEPLKPGYTIEKLWKVL